jgi:hypothetical protein
MKLESVQSLKNELLAGAKGPVAAMASALSIRSMSSESVTSVRRTIALGVAHHKGKEFKLAIRVQRQELVNSALVEQFTAKAKGEVDVRYVGKIEAVKALYAEYGAWFILIKGFTPIPFKLVTIVSGFMDYPLAAFVGLALLTRGARFFLLAFLFNRYGDSLRLFIERHLTAVVLGSLMIIVLGFVLVSRLV